MQPTGTSQKSKRNGKTGTPIANVNARLYQVLRWFLEHPEDEITADELGKEIGAPIHKKASGPVQKTVTILVKQKILKRAKSRRHRKSMTDGRNPYVYWLNIRFNSTPLYAAKDEHSTKSKN